MEDLLDDIHKKPKDYPKLIITFSMIVLFLFFAETVISLIEVKSIVLAFPVIVIVCTVQILFCWISKKYWPILIGAIGIIIPGLITLGIIILRLSPKRSEGIVFYGMCIGTALVFLALSTLTRMKKQKDKKDTTEDQNYELG